MRFWRLELERIVIQAESFAILILEKNNCIALGREEKKNKE